jgi:hypothetical protein
VAHEADEPNAVVDLLDPQALAGKDGGHREQRLPGRDLVRMRIELLRKRDPP